jgi:hypothetical protein
LINKASGRRAKRSVRGRSYSVRVLVAGWFSFSGMGTTAGDLMSRDVATSWLAEARIPYDIAAVTSFGEGLDWRTADPAAFSHVIFVCGPCGNGPPLVEFLYRFRKCRLFGLNLSMLQPLEQWNPFEALFERDSTRAVRPDLSFLHESTSCRVAGLILAPGHREYETRGRHAQANQALSELLRTKKIVAIPIDTCLETNATGLTNPSQVEAIIGRMDFVATTRLHGLALALKSGVPALAIDPIKGNAKLRHQADVLGWPAAIGIDELSENRLADLCAYCLTAEARTKARECGMRAIKALRELQYEFLAAIMRPAA